MNRRTFLGSLAAPLLAAPVLAQTLKTHPATPHPAKYTCVIGNYERNNNGHIYPKKIWMKMFGDGMPLCMLGEDENDLKNLAGRVVAFQVGAEQVSVTIGLYRTEKGILAREMIHLMPMYLALNGNGGVNPTTGVVEDDYTTRQFMLSIGSSFKCATPLTLVQSESKKESDDADDDRSLA